MTLTTNNILSPQLLWKDFDTSLPLKPSYISEDISHGVTTKSLYFSGRQTQSGRVRIFALFAQPIDFDPSKNKGALLILPDCTQTANGEMVIEYAKQGYSVLMIDYRGVCEKTELFTKYPPQISYANYFMRGRHLDFADESAFETCAYEWVSCARFAVSFLLEQSGVQKVGILGIKEGANIAFMTAGCDNRIDCIVPLFGAGWRAYKGFNKYSLDELELTEERMRYISGADAQSYVQSITCPVFYMTATNSTRFDIDRSVDTILRISSRLPQETRKKLVQYVNYAPRLNDYLDERCKRSVELFLAKYLNEAAVDFPQEPKIEVNVSGKDVNCTVLNANAGKARVLSVEVFISEGMESSAFRDWNEMRFVGKRTDVSAQFEYKLNGNASFINVFARVTHRNGLTVCSLLTTKKINEIKERDNKLIYSSKSGLSSFTISKPKDNVEFDLFLNNAFIQDGEFDRNMLQMVDCLGIAGITSKYGLVSYKTNKTYVKLTDRSIFSADVFVNEFSKITVTLVTCDEKNIINEYVASYTVSGAGVWQTILLECDDFKANYGFSIKDYSTVCAIKIEFTGIVVFNNILLI